MDAAAITSGIRLVVDNPGFRPSVFESKLKRRRAFEARFRLVRNQALALVDSRFAASAAAHRNVMHNVIGFAPSPARNRPSSKVSAKDFADWLELSHTEHCVRHVAEFESVAFTDILPSSAVIAQSVDIMRTRGFAVKVRYSDRGASFFMVRRWS